MARQYAPDMVRKIVIMSLEMYRDQLQEDASELNPENPQLGQQLLDRSDQADEIHTQLLNNELELVLPQPADQS